jgi:FlaA1/EpsC-like NDP-sugar epimerase
LFFICSHPILSAADYGHHEMQTTDKYTTRRKVLITGGSGTVGQAFIERYQDEFDFYNVSRNETYIDKLRQNFPQVQSFVSDVQDLDHLTNLFRQIKPDIVIHAAALKHVNFAELNPSRTVEINIIGSLNVA